MQNIVPLLWFNDQAEEATAYYTSIFKNSSIDQISRYGEAGPGPSGQAMMIDFTLDGQPFKALNGFDGSTPRNEVSGIALFVTCGTQDDLDHVWDSLLAGGQAIACGWLRDKYGFAWNVVPDGIGAYLGGDDEAGRERAMRAMLQMVKLDVRELKRAYEGG